MTRGHGWLRLLLVVGVAAPACAPRDQMAEQPGEVPRAEQPAGEPLTASVQAMPMGEQVHFTLQVTNASDAPLELEFTSGQTHDFEVVRDGQALWRWSDDMMFTQALHSEMLPAGETRRFEAMWTPPAEARGRLTVVGILTSSNHRLEQSTEFEVR